MLINKKLDRTIKVSLLTACIFIFANDVFANRTLNFLNFQREFGINHTNIMNGWTSPDLGVHTGFWEFAGWTITLTGTNVRSQNNGNHIIDPNGTFVMTINLGSNNVDPTLDVSYDAGTTQVSAGETFNWNAGQLANAADLGTTSNWWTDEDNDGAFDTPYNNNYTFAADGGVVVGAGPSVTNTANFDIWSRQAGGPANWENPNAANGFSVTFTQGNVGTASTNLRNFTFVVTPEPSSSLMLISSLAMLASIRRRRKAA